MEDEEQLQQDYAIWKKNAPFLYDLLIAHSLTWPSLTTQWLPGSRIEQECIVHRLLLGTHTDEETPNALFVAEVSVPTDTAVDGNKDDAGKGAETGIRAPPSGVKVIHELPHEGEVNRARYMPQNPDIIATEAVTGEVFVYDLKADNGRAKGPQMVLKGHTDEGYGLSWNTHTKGRLLSCSTDKTVCIWDIGEAPSGTMNPCATFEHHEAAVNDVSWHSADPHTFASVGDDKLLILYDARMDSKTAAVKKVEAHQNEINCVAFHPTLTTLLATGSADHTLGLFDTRKMDKPLHVLAHHSDLIYQIAWNPHNESCIASSSADRRLMVWDLSKVGDEQAREDAEDGPAELLFVHGGHTSRIMDFSWNTNPGAEWMLSSVADDNVLQVYTPASAVLLGN